MKTKRKIKRWSRLNSTISSGTANNLTDLTSSLQQTLSPDEQTVQKLNRLAKQYPFCIWYRHRNHTIL
jgi:hypothetical protein